MFVTIHLDKARNLRYGIKALALLEKALNKPLAKINMDELTIEEIVTFLWAGLVHEDKELTPEELLDVLDKNNVDLTYIANKITEALELSFTGGKADDNKKK